MLCPIWTARDLNLWPPAPETNVLPLDQLAGHIDFWFCYSVSLSYYMLYLYIFWVVAKIKIIKSVMQIFVCLSVCRRIGLNNIVSGYISTK